MPHPAIQHLLATAEAHEHVAKHLREAAKAHSEGDHARALTHHLSALHHSETAEDSHEAVLKAYHHHGH